MYLHSNTGTLRQRALSDAMTDCCATNRSGCLRSVPYPTLVACMITAVGCIIYALNIALIARDQPCSAGHGSQRFRTDLAC